MQLAWITVVAQAAYQAPGSVQYFLNSVNAPCTSLEKCMLQSQSISPHYLCGLNMLHLYACNELNCEEHRSWLKRAAHHNDISVLGCQSLNGPDEDIEALQ